MLELIIFIIAILFAIGYIVLYIKMLVEQLKKKRFYWFVLSLLFSPMWIVYWIYTRFIM